jgi:hypothetical protein
MVTLAAPPAGVTRVGVYVRISKDTEQTGLGVDRQEEDCCRVAEARGWEIAEVILARGSAGQGNGRDCRCSVKNSARKFRDRGDDGRVELDDVRRDRGGWGESGDSPESPESPESGPVSSSASSARVVPTSSWAGKPEMSECPWLLFRGLYA